MAKVSPVYQAKFEPSDIVQQTLLDACKDLEGFRGESETELEAWLSRMLLRNLLDAVRKFRSQKRNVAREVQAVMSKSGSKNAASRWFAAEHTSPSSRVVRSEELQRMTAAIDRLPETQRQAINLHHLCGCTLSEVAAQMQRSTGAVAGLLHRGLRTLRREFGETI